MLRIPRSILDAVIAHARRGLPNEACGYLAGKVCSAGGAAEIAAHFPLTNVDASPEHFGFDPAEQFAALRQAGGLGLKLAACYHSHPATPARPSAEDIRLAYDPGISYVIVSLAAEAPEVKSFRIRNGEATPEGIEVAP
ncbi:MAG: M67 family metallopeptidase [Candidatus Accumulibacter sp.]|nr:M67 family metallopeptidase [Accumulibacter sp.]